MSKRFYTFLFCTLLLSGLKAQMFKHYGAGPDIRTFYHQQGIDYHLGSSDDKGQLYFVHYDTVSSGFQYGKEFSTIRLQIYNGLTWLCSKPVQLFSRNTLDAPRVLDLQFYNGKVYLAGSFDSSSNNLGAGLIAFDGSDWQSTNAQLMQTFPDYFEVKQILAFAGNLFITGNFDSIPGERVNGLLWHDGSSWKPVGQSAPYGFRNLSGTGNVFFKVVNDSLYAYNKNKINPDSIEIGGTVSKRLAVFSSGGFKPSAHSGHLIAALTGYGQALVSINTSEKIYTSTFSVRQGNSWTDHLLPDSFYATNYIGSFEKNGDLYLLFQNPAPAEIRVYKFDGTRTKLFRTFKISAQYLNLEFFSENGFHILSGPFQEISISDYKERHNKVLGLLFEPMTQLSGICFHDLNLDGSYQSGEPLLSNCKVYDRQNAFLANSDAGGRYALNLPLGSGVSISAVSENGLVSIQDLVLVNSTESLMSFNFAMQGRNTDDVGVFITAHSANKAKQGFISTYHIDVVNHSDDNKNISIQVGHSPKLSNRNLKSFSPVSANRAGFVFVLNLDGHSAKRYFFEGVYGVDSFALGENVQVSCKTLTADDQNSNNSDTVFQTVKAAFDPNIKVANPSVVVNKDKLIQYVIWFQNEGNDTALNVTVVDTFGSLFDLSAVYLGHNSHPCEIEVINNCILWHFRGIRLPPKKEDSLNSIGFVSFRSKLAKKAVLGDTILNKAAIFFDYQKPIITNSAKVLYDKNVSVRRLAFADGFQFYPNPGQGLFYYNSQLPAGEMLEICDVNGKVVMQFAAEESGSVQLPENTASGLYIVRIQRSGLALGKLMVMP